MKRMIGLLMVMGLVVGFVGCSGDSDSPTGPSNEISKWRKDLGEGFGNSVQQTVDSGFIVTGFNYGTGHLFLLKTDGQGNEEWKKTFGGGEGNSVQQTVDSGFIVTGWEDWENTNLLLFKTDGQGNQEWRKTFRGGWGEAVQQTADGGFIVTGGYGVFLLKTDDQGNQEWRTTIGDGEGNSVQQTVDGGFIVTGYHDDDDDLEEDYGLFLLKIEGQGNEKWRKTFGDGEGHSVQQTIDGGFIVTGYQYAENDFEEDYGLFLLKTDGQGNEEWRKTFGDGEGHSVQQTIDGGFIVTGQDLDSYVLLLKADGQGNEVWRKIFGVGRGFSVQQTVDGEFIVTGQDLDGDVFLLKADGQGNI